MSNSPPLKTKETGSRKKEVQALSQNAYDYLIHKLLTRQLVPGDLINRRQVAHELNMSVAPVLEAMVQLQNDGFLESIPRKGTLVRSIKPEDLRGQVLLREALECEAARFYCGKKIIENSDRLHQMAEETEKTHDAMEISWKTEFEFHRALVELAGCPPLTNIYEKVMRHKLFMAQNLFLSVHPESDQNDHNNHHKLLEALETENPEEAERAIRHHIRSGKMAILKLPANSKA